MDARPAAAPAPAVIQIGRKPSSAIHLNHPRVSGLHAELVKCTETEFVLIDKGSTNGTFVNGLRIDRYGIAPETIVSFANEPDLTFSLADLFQKYYPAWGPKPPPPPKSGDDFTAEFAAMKDFEQTYKKALTTIKNKRKGIRIGAPALGLMLMAVPGVNAVAGLAMVVSALMTNLITFEEAEEAAKNDFRKKFICPRCRSSLMSRTWEQWAELKKCPNCKCTWVAD